MSEEVNQTIKKLEELENLALTPNEKGEINLSLAVKIEELKLKLLQTTSSSDSPSSNKPIEVFVQNKRQKKIVDEI